MSYIPIRSCVSCGAKRPKQALLRIVKSPSGVFEVDTGGKKSGRGAYLCRDPECIQKARKRRGFERSYRGAVPESLYQGTEAFLEEIRKEDGSGKQT